MTYQVDILNPKAGKLLQDLADLDLIAIRQTPQDGFLNVLNKLRTKAKTVGKAPSLEEITAEVEAVRAKRYARHQG